VIGEHQYEILDFVAAKFHEELGVFKLLVMMMITVCVIIVRCNYSEDC